MDLLKDYMIVSNNLHSVKLESFFHWDLLISDREERIGEGWRFRKWLAQF